jgi:hypothetical protein
LNTPLLAKNDPKEDENKDDQEEEENENDQKEKEPSYDNIERDFGSGEIRLGRVL